MEAGAARGRAGRGGEVVSAEDVEAAARRIAGVVRRTALMVETPLDELCGCRVVLKPEQFQRGGSFKLRGAYNRLRQAAPAEVAAGVVAYSSGNHGAAVALAAGLLGMEATVVVPSDAPAIKLRAIREYGARVVTYDPARESREEVAAAIVAEHGSLLVPPFDDPRIIAGQGTVGLEIAEDAGELDAVLVPIGGGGLASGVATAVTARMPGCRVVGVEPAGADDTRRSLAAGHRVAVEEVRTIADGLRAAMPGELTFAVNQGLLDEVVAVEDAAISEAMRTLFERVKVVVEPSGAVGVAALLSGAFAAPGGRVGVVLSGGNVDAGRFAELIA
ncbi:MAG TPA: threonine/serine dehydratase [Acidimicrobiales bacterium]|nr:threonine/serine dehydratase [Acidimicrobiales bacterium]